MDSYAVKSLVADILYDCVRGIDGASIGYVYTEDRGSYFFCDIGMNIRSRSLMSTCERQLGYAFSEIKRKIYPETIRFDVGYVVG